MSATVVLVHGGFVDGSGWRGVHDELRAQTSMATRIGATVVETPGSHASYLSQPKMVADIIRSAAVRAV